MKNNLTLTSVPVRPVLWNTHHDQPENRRVAVVAIFNRQLVDLIDLGLQAKQAHWNVKGRQFAVLHAFFDELAEEVDKFTDLLAERAVVLGGVATGTSQVVVRDTHLPTYPIEAFNGAEHLWALSTALAHVAQSVRAAITLVDDTGDASSADVLTQVSRGIDTLLWKTEAHIAAD